VIYLAVTVNRWLDHNEEISPRSFFMRFVTALTLPAGQASPDRPRVQGLNARGQQVQPNQERQRKSPKKAS
jgi:hypothetical protein